MSRVGWFRWIIKHGSRGTRLKQIGLLLSFEAYRVICKLCGVTVPHLLESESPAAGKYLVLEKRLPLGVRLLNRIFPFGKTAHYEFIPYNLEMVNELKEASRIFRVVEIAPEFKFREA